MIVLGINFKHGDSSACLIKNDKILSAIEEERFIGIKHCSHFPINSIKYCLVQNNLEITDVDYIAINSLFSYNLKDKFIFLLKNLKNFYNDFSISLKANIASKELYNIFKINLKDKIVSVPHHLSHVFSTIFFEKPNKDVLVYSFDGSGDFSTKEIYLGNIESLKLIQKNIFPHSLGFYYMAFTQFLGFTNFGDEYKVMALAALGKPIYEDKVLNLINNTSPFKLNYNFFNYPKIEYINNYPVVKKLYSKDFIKLFGQPRNTKDTKIDEYYLNIASSMQKVFEDLVINELKLIKKKYAVEDLYLTGGCAFNSLLVGKIIKSKIFQRVEVGPNPGDAGGAIGAALYTLFKRDKFKKDNFRNITFSNPYLGPTYTNQFIKNNLIDKILDKNKYKYKFVENFDELAKLSAKILKQKDVIFWFQDNMEWGPRALGNRSILGNPKNENIKEIINVNIKKREEFRPFAPVVMTEFAEEYFEMYNNNSEFMNKVFYAKQITKEKYSGIIHQDGSCRLQTVSEDNNKKLYLLLKKFNDLTGSPILINTSLNVSGPIARSPMDAYNYFNKTMVDTMVINNWLIEKN